MKDNMSYKKMIVTSVAFVSAISLALPMLGVGSVGAISKGSSSAHMSPRAVSSVTGTVVFMIPNTVPSRYIEQDAPDFIAAMKKLAPNVTVQTVNAGGDQTLQQTQAAAAITAGAKALVVVAANPPLSGGLLSYAKDKNVPVIGYENVPINGPMYAQIEFSPYQAGALQGQYFAQMVTSGKLGKFPVTLARIYGNNGDVYNTQMQIGQNKYLDPLIKSNKVKVVCSSYAAGWAGTAAQDAMSQCLTAQHNKVRSVLTVYDGETEAIIAALTSAHLKAGLATGSVAVFGGQNPTSTGLALVIQGNQQDDVIKPNMYEANAAAELTVSALEGKTPAKILSSTSAAWSSVDSGKGDMIPTYLLSEAYVTAGSTSGAQIDKYVVKTGTFTWAQICVGTVASSAVCKKYNK